MITIIGGDGKSYGPVPVDQVKRWIQEGRANLDTLARGNGQADWRKLRDLPEFSLEAGTPPPLATAEVPAAEPASPATSVVTPATQAIPDESPAQAFRSESVPESPRPAAAPKLASRGVRLLAALIDGILSMLFALPGLVMLSSHLVENGGRMPPLGSPAFTASLSAVGVIGAGWIVLMIVQFSLLATRGQTVGKKLLGIRIVRFTDGVNPGFVHSVLLRAVVTTILDNIPWIGLVFWVVDSCFIFREDRRCIHDLIADTIVVDE